MYIGLGIALTAGSDADGGATLVTEVTSGSGVFFTWGNGTYVTWSA